MGDDLFGLGWDSASVHATTGKQARPTITHKLEVLAAVSQMCTRGRSMPCTPAMKQLALSHYSCCGNLSLAKIKEWRSQAPDWHEMSKEVKDAHYRMPNELRVKRGFTKIGSAGPLVDFDPGLNQLVNKVVEKADERAAEGRAPSFEDLHTTFVRQLAKLKEERVKENARIDGEVLALRAGLEAGDQVDARVAVLEAQRLPIPAVTGSKGWTASTLYRVDCNGHKQQTRGESNMRPLTDSEYVKWCQKRDAELSRWKNVDTPWLRCNFDECPVQMYYGKGRGWCTDKPLLLRKAKKEGNIWADLPGHAKDFFTAGTTTTPFGIGVLWLHFKADAPGGEKSAREANKKFSGRAVVERSGTGYMVKELWNRKVLPMVVMPTLDGVRSRFHTYKGSGNPPAVFFFDNAGSHNSEDARAEIMQRHEVKEMPLLSRTSGHTQPNDQLHFVLKARYGKLIRHKLGRSGDIIDDQVDYAKQNRTPSGSQRGINIMMVTTCMMDAWSSLSTKTILAAWVLTGNVNIDEGIRILRHMDVETKDATREDLFAAASELSRENVDARQPDHMRRTLDDIVPTPGVSATDWALRNATLREAPWRALAGILRGDNADFGTTPFEHSGKKYTLLSMTHAGKVLHCIRRKATREPISRQDLQDSGIGHILQKYANSFPVALVRKQAQDMVCLLKAQFKEQRARLDALSAATPGAVDHAAPGDASRVCDQCGTCTTSVGKFCSDCGAPTKQRARVAYSTPAPQASGIPEG
jgi:hypothetical protein